jgi:hypothetical protein
VNRNPVSSLGRGEMLEMLIHLLSRYNRDIAIEDRASGETWLAKFDTAVRSGAALSALYALASVEDRAVIDRLMK